MPPSPALNNGDLFEELEASSSSTKQGYDTGTRTFNKFAAHQKVKELGEVTFEDCAQNDADLVKKLFCQFASFLIEYKQVNGKHIKPDCQLQYLSGAMNVLRKKYKKALALKEGMDENLVSDVRPGRAIAAIRVRPSHLSTILFIFSGTRISTNSCGLVAVQKQ